MKWKQGEVGEDLKDFILGFQDGVVNVLGIVLAVATAASELKIVLIAGLAAAFAESISMAAVAYTSTKSLRDFHASELSKKKNEIKNNPKREEKHLRKIYFKKGFRGKLLDDVVKKLTSKKSIFVKTIVEEELKIGSDPENPIKSAFIVGFSAILGSFVPVLPFFLIAMSPARFVAIIISVITLFIVGYVKAKLTIGDPIKSGIEISAIGIVSALAGYVIGAFLGAIV